MTLILTPHSASASLTMLSYDREAGQVVIKTTDPTPDLGYEVSRMSLAQFLHGIGIPFPHARLVAQQPAPELEPAA